MHTHLGLFYLVSLNWHTNTGIIYFKEITTATIAITTVTTTNNKVNANLGAGPKIQIAGQSHKHKCKFRRQN